MDEHGTGMRVLTAAGVGVALIAWTAAVLPFLAVAGFAMADTSCDGPPRLQTGALWWPGTVLGVWLAPFVGVATWRRSRVAVLVALVALVVAATVLARIVSEPAQFCF